MAKISSQQAPQFLSFETIAEIYAYRKASFKFYFSQKNPNFQYIFTGFTHEEINDAYRFQLEEIENDASFNTLAAIEAAFRIDLACRIEKKDKASISKRFQTLVKDYFSETPYQVPLRDVILEEWKQEQEVNNGLISALKDAFLFRNWYAHGRHWPLKAGRNKYDFGYLYDLALKVKSLPLKNL